MSPQQQLAQALAAAKKRRVKPVEKQPGLGTNENGPRVQTNAPANSWPTDGDSNG